jgi:adenylosuccinate synthase
VRNGYRRDRQLRAQSCRRRAGHLDAVALRYAAEVSGGVDEIALTHLDIATRHRELRVCEAYQADGERIGRVAPGPARDLEYQEQLTAMLLRARPVYTDPGGDWAGIVEQATGAAVILLSSGPKATDKRLRLKVPHH